MGPHRMGDRRRPQSCNKVSRAGRILKAKLGAENPGICPRGPAPLVPLGSRSWPGWPSGNGSGAAGWSRGSSESMGHLGGAMSARV
jgi:hypothetical protein